MSLLDSYQQKLEKLQRAKETLLPVKDIPEVSFTLLLIENQIRDTQSMLNRFTTSRGSHCCMLCSSWKKADEVTIIENSTVCHSCTHILSQMMTTNEAEALWCLPKGTLKRDCRSDKLSKYRMLGLVRQSGRYWQIHEKVVTELYGSPKIQKEKKTPST
jgi:hypothetical protein